MERIRGMLQNCIRGTFSRMGRAARWIKRDPFRSLFIMALLLGAIVVSFDVYPRVKNGWARVGIGQVQPGPRYYEAVKSVAKAWLLRLPPSRYNDHTRLLIIDHLRGKHYAPQAKDFEGLLLLGYAAAAVRDNKDEDWRTIDQCLSRAFDENTGRFRVAPHFVDEAVVCYAVLQLPQAYRQRYRPALDQMAGWLLERSERWGTVPFRQSGDDMLVDSLGMICPFLALYGVRYGNDEAVELAIRQLDRYVQYGTWPKPFLPMHGYAPQVANAPLGIAGWGRGTGWLALGLIDTYAALPAEHPARERLAGYIRSLADTLRGCQMPDGGWNAVLTQEASPFDSSATAILAYFVARGVSLGVLPDADQRAVNRAVSRLTQATRADGTVDFSQNGAFGVGRYSVIHEPSTLTQGMVLRLLCGTGRELQTQGPAR